MAQHLPAFGLNWAFFLDVDGTLLDIVQHPDDVQCGPGLIDTLAALHCIAPVALISGRPIAMLDRLFAPLQLPAAGQHGAESRLSNGQVSRQDTHAQAFTAIRPALEQFARQHTGVLLEDKGLTLSLHYRMAPALEGEAQALMSHLLRQLGDDFVLMAGNKVFEIRPRGRDKGQAIATFMQTAPFSGHTPVFVGDDVTDEDGFRIVNWMGGYAIKVGEGATLARGRLEDAGEVLDWLRHYVQWHALQTGACQTPS
ncbi:MAG: trehalose-phosphatase [Gammaproteobacteria bacterium]|nr:trehalose-phosphatase [Gammaproteobacteria bacterium]